MSELQLPELPLAEWQDTLDTLHMWTQIVGKIANAASPLVNHFWNSTLRVTPRGLTTLPLESIGQRFSMEFDLISHELLIRCNDGETRSVKLKPRTVADFYADVMKQLHELAMNVSIWTMPVELADPIRFTEDTVHSSYDAEYVERFRKILVWTYGVFEQFRSRFMGKSSPVHFFWGSFDLAVTRFNGARVPERDEADYITREAYSHACISHGFWCGGGAMTAPAFYGYAAPEPEGLKTANVKPDAGRYDLELNEFILPYDAVRTSPSPEMDVLDFMQTTYAAAADLAKWKRGELERV